MTILHRISPQVPTPQTGSGGFWRRSLDVSWSLPGFNLRRRKKHLSKCFPGVSLAPGEMSQETPPFSRGSAHV